MTQESRVPSDISLASILPFVRASLKGRSNFTFEGFVEGLWSEMEKVGMPGIVRRNSPQGNTGSAYALVSGDSLSRAATEAFYYLLHNGFFAPEPSGFPSLPSPIRCYLTPRGLSWVEAVGPLPEDVDGYMRVLCGLVPNLNAVIEQYVREGLASFERQMFFAGAVMIGAASEKAVYLLADDIMNALKDGSRKETFTKAIERRRLFELLELIQKTVKETRVIPYSVMEGAEAHLMSLFEAIRVQRNDAVHPMNATVSGDSVRLSFHAFPHALRKLETLRGWFRDHPHTI